MRHYLFSNWEDAARYADMPINTTHQYSSDTINLVIWRGCCDCVTLGNGIIFVHRGIMYQGIQLHTSVYLFVCENSLQSMKR